MLSAGLGVALWAGTAAAQQSLIEAERREFAAWLTTSPLSPYAAVAQRLIGPGLTVGGPESDIPLRAFGAGRIVERSGSVILEGAPPRVIPRGRFVPIGEYRFQSGGEPGRSMLLIHSAAPREAKVPEWFGYSSALVLTVTLRPPPAAEPRRLLAPDGFEVQGFEAGTVDVTVAGKRVTLLVRRLPQPDGEESELEIFFRDGTNDKTTYPAGRFVQLEPAGGDRYRLDFNRARNPHCAYSSVFACPAPWRGNLIPAPIEAGEKYGGGGLTPP